MRRPRKPARATSLEGRYAEDDRIALLRALQFATGDRFSALVVEVKQADDVGALLSWLREHLPGEHVEAIDMAEVGEDPWRGLSPRVPDDVALRRKTVWVLTGFEQLPGVLSDPAPAVFRTWNVQRDLLVKSLPLRMVLCLQPGSGQKLREVAPDLVDFLVTWISRSPQASRLEQEGLAMRALPSIGALIHLAEPDWPPLLREADDALVSSQRDRARDALASFGFRDEAAHWRVEASLLATRLLRQDAQHDAADARLAALELETRGERTVRRVKVLLECVDTRMQSGPADDHNTQPLEEARRIAEVLDQAPLRWQVALWCAYRDALQGEVADALLRLEGQILPGLWAVGRERLWLWAVDLQCFCLIELGRQREALPFLELALQVANSIGDDHAVARLTTRRITVLVLLDDPDCAEALAESDRSIPLEYRDVRLMLADLRARWLVHNDRAAEARQLLVETILPEEFALRRWREHLLSLGP